MIDMKPFMKMSARDLTFALDMMSERKRNEFYASLAMYDVTATAKVTPVKCKPFKLSDGKFAEREKQVCKGHQSVCRAPHKNRR